MRAPVTVLPFLLLLLAGCATGSALGGGQGAAVDFGADSGEYALDGECDDPRFLGPGSSGGGYPDHELQDASDCRAQYEAGRVAMLAPEQRSMETFTGVADGVDFGDNTSTYAHDGECDDTRFSGAVQSGIEHQMHDAADCRAAFVAGTVREFTAEEEESRGFTGTADGIDFGDNAGLYANDAACDDPRFSGGVGALRLDDHELHDAADCRSAFLAGEAHLLTEEELAARNFTGIADGINFGDNSGAYAHDAECDDPRFEGSAASTGFDDHELRDAADCRTAYLDGGVTLRPGAEPQPDGGFTDIGLTGVDFGSDEGVFANDGECDDPRFTGAGMAGEGLESHVAQDATDCRAAYDAGDLTLRSDAELFQADVFSGVYDGIDFGADDGTYARDGECDDLRFVGPGTSGGSIEDHEYRDASDCQSAYASGQAYLALHGVDPGAARYDGVEFGDNFGEFPNDGVCDDPRFEGDGVGQTALMESDIGHDARDCLMAWLNGGLALKGEALASAR